MPRQDRDSGSGAELFMKAHRQHCLADNNLSSYKYSFELWQKCIKKILKDEDVTAPVPTHIQYTSIASELLSTAWFIFCDYFHEIKLRITQESSPEAFKLVSSFRPSQRLEQLRHPQFARAGQKGEVVYKAMQICSAGVLAFLTNGGDRPTAAKRYEEAIQVANTHPPFITLNQNSSVTEIGVHKMLYHIKRNLEDIKRNDELISSQAVDGPGFGRKETITNTFYTRCELNTRTGDIRVLSEEPLQIATAMCWNCQERGSRLKKCGRCLKAAYCNAQCQKANWQKHKVDCQSKAADLN